MQNLRKTIIGAAALLLAANAFADPINFGTTVGDATGGSGSAQMDTEPAVNVTTLEAGLGLLSGTLQTLSNVYGNGATVTEGSGVVAQFLVSAGDVISFDWNFLTNETCALDVCGGVYYNDFAFYSFGVSDILADTFFSPLETGTLGYDAQTGFQSFSVVAGSSGIATLTLGVVDVGDSVVTSALIIENAAVNGYVAVPEPGTLGLLGFGLVALGLRRRPAAA